MPSDAELAYSDPFYRSLPETVSEFFVGLDLGQSHDYTALAALERTSYPRDYLREKRPPKYGVRHLQRWPLGTAYPAIVADVHTMLTTVDPSGRKPLAAAPLIVDASGVGRAVVDMFRAGGTVRRLVPVVITAGASAHYDAVACCYRCAKRELVGVLHATAQTGRLHFAAGMKEEAALRRELATFQEKITAAGNLTYESWREQEHDDMILALAVALWFAERFPLTVSRPPELVAADGFVFLGRQGDQAPSIPPAGPDGFKAFGIDPMRAIWDQ